MSNECARLKSTLTRVHGTVLELRRNAVKEWRIDFGTLVCVEALLIDAFLLTKGSSQVGDITHVEVALECWLEQ